MAGNKVDEEAEHCMKRGPSQWESNSSNRKPNKPCNRPDGGWVAGRGWGGHRAGWRREHGPRWREGWSWAWIRGAARQNNQKTRQHRGKPQWGHEVHGRPNDGELEQTRSTETWLCCQCQVTFLQTRPRYIPSSISSAILWNIKESLCPAEQLLSRSQELFRRCALPTGGRCPGPVCASSRSHSSTSPQGTGIVSKEPSGSTAVRVFLKLDLSKNDHFSGPHGPFRQKTISCLHF